MIKMEIILNLFVTANKILQSIIANVDASIDVDDFDPISKIHEKIKPMSQILFLPFSLSKPRNIVIPKNDICPKVFFAA